mgnify:CR=1 FL=1
MTKLQPKDLIAFLVVGGIIIMKLYKVDGGLDTAGALIVGYYFGHRANGIDKGV